MVLSQGYQNSKPPQWSTKYPCDIFYITKSFMKLCAYLVIQRTIKIQPSVEISSIRDPIQSETLIGTDDFY